MLCLYSGFVAGLEEIFQAFVSEADNHVTNIDCNPMGGNRKTDTEKVNFGFYRHETSDNVAWKCYVPTKPQVACPLSVLMYMHLH